MHLVRRQYIYMNISNVITLQILPTNKKILHEEKTTRKKTVSMICILHIERVLKGKSKQIKQRLVKYADVFRKNQHRNCFSRISKTDSLYVRARARCSLFHFVRAGNDLAASAQM